MDQKDLDQSSTQLPEHLPKKKQSENAWQLPYWMTLILKFAVAAVLLVVVGVFALYIGVQLEFFGDLPSKAELKAIQNPVASQVVSADGYVLGKYYIENRTNVKYTDISENILKALVATEDERFFEHNGVDTRSLFRVFFKTLMGGDRSSGGGSTLSQQLAKNLYPRQPYFLISMAVNKMREAVIATRLEEVYTKEELLTLYLNTVPFGERAFGIGTAAKRFFDTNPKDITLEQAATLIGLLKAPSAYSPRRYPDKAKARRNVVLGQMVRKGFITEARAKEVQQLPLVLVYNRETASDGLAPHFRQELKKVLKKWCNANTRLDGSPYNLFTDGLVIRTSIDSRMQQYAEQAVALQMGRLQSLFNEHWKDRPIWKKGDAVVEMAKKRSRRYERLKKRGVSSNKVSKIFNTPVKMKLFSWKGAINVEMTPLDSVKYYLQMLNAGFLAMSPQTGHIKAWVGGTNHYYFQNDHVLGTRQVGSTFKPLVYATALDNNISPCKYYPNERFIYKEHQNWSPRNSGDEYGGAYSMKGGLSKSINTVSVQILLETGLQKVLQIARSMGIYNDIPEVPSISLGTAELSLFEMLGAYSSFANGGHQTPPIYLLSIEDQNGRTLEAFDNPPAEKRKKVLSTSTAQMITGMLQSVVNEGTGRRLRFQYKFQGDIAGKTGTTQNQTDGWFIGYTPNLVAGAWVGGEDRRIRFRTIELGQGARTALPVWGNFMEQVYQDPNYAYWANATFPETSTRVAQVMSCEAYVDKIPRNNGELYAENSGILADKNAPDNAVDTDILFPETEEKEDPEKSLWQKMKERLLPSSSTESSTNTNVTNDGQKTGEKQQKERFITIKRNKQETSEPSANSGWSNPFKDKLEQYKRVNTQKRKEKEQEGTFSLEKLRKTARETLKKQDGGQQAVERQRESTREQARESERQREQERQVREAERQREQEQERQTKERERQEKEVERQREEAREKARESERQREREREKREKEREKREKEAEKERKKREKEREKERERAKKKSYKDKYRSSSSDRIKRSEERKRKAEERKRKAEEKLRKLRER